MMATVLSVRSHQEQDFKIPQARGNLAQLSASTRSALFHDKDAASAMKQIGWPPIESMASNLYKLQTFNLGGISDSTMRLTIDYF